MLSRLDLSVLPADLAAVLPRPNADVAHALEGARALIDDVRARGGIALLDQAERFDRVRPESLRVSAAELDAALAELQPEVRAALERAAERVRAGARAQVPAASVTTFADGATVEQRWQPVQRVGLYVPGGKAVYPSSVIMNVVTAQAAGVAEIAVASPAQAEFGGRPHPLVTATCALLGVDELWAMGGAGAIGALAYGVPDIGLAAVDVVTGPGNVFVAAAKRLVSGSVGIDAEAGPTEILIIADDGAAAEFVAADLISQAEHDELAAAVLVTDSAALADAVDAELERQVRETANADRVRASLGGAQSRTVLVSDMASAAAISNAYAPEHLELHTRDNTALLERITNAGAIFVGAYTPVSLGDYAAGSNHVLPTGGQARFAAGLSAATFLRPQQIVEYSKDALAEIAPTVTLLAASEHLPAHADAVTVRLP